MKKLIILFVLPVLLYSCGSGEPKAEETTATTEEETVQMVRSDLSNDHMNGPIQSFTETPYTPDEQGNISEMDSCCIIVEEFDDNGFMTTSTWKNMAGEVTRVGNMEHTEEGKFVSYTSTENGVQKFKRVVDRSGDQMKAMDSDSTGQVTRVHVPDEMNENDQPVKGKTYLADGTTLDGIWTWQYIDGNRVGNSWTDSTGVQRWSAVGEVNDKGWVSKRTETEMGEDGTTTTVVKTFTYDSMDDMGNWTQRTTYEDGKATEVLKRTYAYYEN
jgi:hypothetical protein